MILTKRSTADQPHTDTRTTTKEPLLTRLDRDSVEFWTMSWMEPERSLKHLLFWKQHSDHHSQTTKKLIIKVRLTPIGMKTPVNCPNGKFRSSWTFPFEGLRSPNICQAQNQNLTRQNVSFQVKLDLDSETGELKHPARWCFLCWSAHRWVVRQKDLQWKLQCPGAMPE